MSFKVAEFVGCGDVSSSCLRLMFDKKPQLLAELREHCEGKNECIVSVTSLSSDPCPLEMKYFFARYNCEIMQRGYAGKINENI